MLFDFWAVLFGAGTGPNPPVEHDEVLGGAMSPEELLHFDALNDEEFWY